MVDWNSQATWNALYNIDGVEGYNRTNMIKAYMPDSPDLDFYIDRMQNLVSRNVLTPNTDVLVVGCGIPFLCEVINSFGGNAYGMDNSTLIQALALTESTASDRLLLGNIFTNASILINTLLKPVFGGNGKVDVVITEDLLSVLSDSEIPTVLAQCEGLVSANGIIVHMIMCDDGRPTPRTFTELGGLYWRTLETYAAYNPNHLWISLNEKYRALGSV